MPSGAAWLLPSQGRRLKAEIGENNARCRAARVRGLNGMKNGMRMYKVKGLGVEITDAGRITGLNVVSLDVNMLISALYRYSRGTQGRGWK